VVQSGLVRQRVSHGRSASREWRGLFRETLRAAGLRLLGSGHLGLLDEQNRILRAIVPFHAQLQQRGQLEVSTSPHCHPILPLLIDTDETTVDRSGATLPARFAWPEDAEAHISSACHVGRDPRGMWPAEGAVSQRCIPLFAGAGLAWLATDRGVARPFRALGR
jgi:alpha-amylase/alpha-mannosidase (GH57 family)